MPSRGTRGGQAEDEQPLTVLELDAPELGIRPEDRFAAIPPGPRLIPRRHHDESSSAPFVLLAGLVAFFVLGAWLGGAGSDENERTGGATEGPLPVLDQGTGTTVLLFGDRVTALDLDRSPPLRSAVPRLRDVADDVLDDAVLVPSAAPGRAWLATPEPDGGSVVREVDLADGSAVTPPVRVDGRVVGAVTAGVVVERAPGRLELVAADGTVVRGLGEQRVFLAAAGDAVATRSSTCRGAECAVTVDDLATGATRELQTELATVGAELAALSPGGRRLGVLRSAGVETRGIVVDLRLETVAQFRARGVPRGAAGGVPALGWSPDGGWLFIATARGGLDAVASDGLTYRVDAEVPTFTGIMTR